VTKGFVFKGGRAHETVDGGRLMAVSPSVYGQLRRRYFYSRMLQHHRDGFFLGCMLDEPDGLLKGAVDKHGKKWNDKVNQGLKGLGLIT